MVYSYKQLIFIFSVVFLADLFDWIWTFQKMLNYKRFSVFYENKKWSDTDLSPEGKKGFLLTPGTVFSESQDWC